VPRYGRSIYLINIETPTAEAVYQSCITGSIPEIFHYCLRSACLDLMRQSGPSTDFASRNFFSFVDKVLAERTAPSYIRFIPEERRGVCSFQLSAASRSTPSQGGSPQLALALL